MLRKTFFIFSVLFAATPAFAQLNLLPETPINFEAVEITIINKKLGKSEIFTLTPNMVMIYNTLEIQAERCFEREGEQSSWLSISKLKDGSEAFSGWIYANFPGVSGLSDPTYQIILNKCS